MTAPSTPGTVSGQQTGAYAAGEVLGSAIGSLDGYDKLRRAYGRAVQEALWKALGVFRWAIRSAEVIGTWCARHPGFAVAGVAVTLVTGVIVYRYILYRLPVAGGGLGLTGRVRRATENLAGTARAGSEVWGHMHRPQRGPGTPYAPGQDFRSAYQSGGAYGGQQG